MFEIARQLFNQLQLGSKLYIQVSYSQLDSQQVAIQLYSLVARYIAKQLATYIQVNSQLTSQLYSQITVAKYIAIGSQLNFDFQICSYLQALGDSIQKPFPRMAKQFQKSIFARKTFLEAYYTALMWLLDRSCLRKSCLTCS